MLTVAVLMSVVRVSGLTRDGLGLLFVAVQSQLEAPGLGSGGMAMLALGMEKGSKNMSATSNPAANTPKYASTRMVNPTDFKPQVPTFRARSQKPQHLGAV